MRKLLAIFLISIHLFSIGGQWFLHQYFAYKTEKFYNQQAAKGKYNVADLTEIVIPVKLNNMQDWAGYENVSGQIQFKQTSFNYVKMRLTHNAMHLLCVPNYNDTQLLSSNIIAAKGVKNIPLPKKEHVPAGKSISLNSIVYNFTSISFSNYIQYITSIITEPIQQPSYNAKVVPEQPPRLFS